MVGDSSRVSDSSESVPQFQSDLSPARYPAGMDKTGDKVCGAPAFCLAMVLNYILLTLAILGAVSVMSSAYFNPSGAGTSGAFGANLAIHIFVAVALCQRNACCVKWGSFFIAYTAACYAIYLVGCFALMGVVALYADVLDDALFYALIVILLIAAVLCALGLAANIVLMIALCKLKTSPGASGTSYGGSAGSMGSMGGGY